MYPVSRVLGDRIYPSLTYVFPPPSLDIPPFMSYAAAYALGNYRLDNPSRGMEYDNLRLVRAFEGGLDPKSSEAGFILTHVDMVKESGSLVNGVVRILNSLENTRNRTEVDDAYRQILAGMEKIEACMEGTDLIRTKTHENFSLSVDKGCAEFLSSHR